jgi:tRNA(Arg) A34 adenosine deaminase TadA
MEQAFMREAIRLARESIEKDLGGPFGAVVVKDGTIIGRGGNRVTSSNDPSAHAEIVAIRDACAHLDDFSLAGCDIYCSCEPCPMCLSAIHWARVNRIFYANGREDAARIGFDDARIHDEIGKPPAKRAVPVRQLLRDEALAVFRLWEAKEDRTPY